MIIDFNKVEEQVIPNFKGGEKEFNAKMNVDENNKIISGRLQPGASIGEHTHETNSEIIFFISGKGKVIYDGKEERVEAGLCHYCPQGHTHTLINDSDAELTFCAVIPEH
ncbi:cupin domain-containing protein [Intestinibacter sp.]